MMILFYGNYKLDDYNDELLSDVDYLRYRTEQAYDTEDLLQDSTDPEVLLGMLRLSSSCLERRYPWARHWIF